MWQARPSRDLELTERGEVWADNEPVCIPGGGYECSLEVPHDTFAPNCDTFVEGRHTQQMKWAFLILEET